MDELDRSFDPATLGDWVQKLPEKYRIMMIDRAREDLAFRLNCVEARRHGIAPVRPDHPAYQYMNDRDNNSIVCE